MDSYIFTCKCGGRAHMHESFYTGSYVDDHDAYYEGLFGPRQFYIKCERCGVETPVGIAGECRRVWTKYMGGTCKLGAKEG